MSRLRFVTNGSDRLRITAYGLDTNNEKNYFDELDYSPDSMESGNCYTFEEYMCDSLKKYRNELININKKINDLERNTIRNFRFFTFGKSYVRKHNYSTHSNTKLERKSIIQSSQMKYRKKPTMNRTMGNLSIHNNVSFDENVFKKNQSLKHKKGTSNIIANNIEEYHMRKRNCSNHSPFVMHMIKKRREFKIMNQRQHRSYLKDKLKEVLLNIEYGYNAFQSKC